MIYNDEKIDIAKVNAVYIIRQNSRDTYIEIISKDGKSITFSFNTIEFDPKKLEKNKKFNLIENIYWDVKLITNDTYYLFDLSKEKVYLTRLDENLFKIEVHIENPDMIHSSNNENPTFNNLLIDTSFSFSFN